MNRTPPDRRRCPRAHVALVASLFQDERCLGNYLVRNLSLGGVLLISGPTLPAGTACRVVLQGAGVTSLRLSGETLRSAPAAGESGLALEFRNLAPGVLAELEEVVAEAIDSENRPGVLVFDSDIATLAKLAEDLHLLGRRALLALTPLEAVRWLCDETTRVEAALVAFERQSNNGADLLAFIAEDFPAVHRVLLHEHDSACELLAAVEESNARALLAKPWTGAALAAALRADRRRPSQLATLSRAS